MTELFERAVKNRLIASVSKFFIIKEKSVIMNFRWNYALVILLFLFGTLYTLGTFLGNADKFIQTWISPSADLWANLFASVAGAFMYFATLTEVPILQGLIGAGMGKGPALALLLAGPALSLPNMLVIRSVMGTQKTIVFVLLVIVMAATSGIIFGALFGG